MRTTKPLLLIVAALVAMPSAVQADVLVRYSSTQPITQADPSSPYLAAPLSSSPAVIADPISAGVGPGTTGLTLQSPMISPTSTWRFSSWSTNDFLSAVAANDVWTWGFDVAPGLNLVQMTTLELELLRNGSLSNFGPDDFAVQLSINGVFHSFPVVFDFNGNDATTVSVTANLASTPLLGPGDSAEFVLAAYNAGNPGDVESGIFEIRPHGGITVNGTISAIPEPSAFLFGGVVCGLVGLVQWKKRLSAAA